ncbi:hypothetical protein [Nannocystis radixulma]|uniref:Uncharacterized protein n=1 Tax=Nannocystis radixulma TaxID=2995305 RepID=A0ABT5B944_9BACT|nr:hypothetical protein [Nannocystis radixulma]MDC0670659.1 hypothetical protein [Nannocystis radixulma]
MLNHIIPAILTANLGVPAAPGALDLEDSPSTVSPAVQLANVAAAVDLTEGFNLELSYELAGVGEVLLAVHADAEGEGESRI